MKAIIYSLLFCFCIAYIISCDGDDPEANVIHITEDIITATTWETGFVYMIEAYDVWVANTLTIQPGVIIKFTNYGAFMSVSAGGSIIAEGTADQPIIFTSAYDDENGGDNNSDGASIAHTGDWAKIRIEENGSVFNYCTFQYGGRYDAQCVLEIYGCYATITNSTFKSNIRWNLIEPYRGVLDASNAEPATVIRNNVFYSNDIPLSVSSEISTDNSNTFHNPNESLETNRMNGIFIYDYDNLDGNVSWEETEVPYVIDDGDFWIDFTGVLNLADNVVLKFTLDSQLSIATTGEFNFNASNIFTAFADDDYLGDTDGRNGTLYNDYWEGIYYDASDSYYFGENIFYNEN